MVDIISRQDWGARAPRRRSTIPIPTEELWLHHTAGNHSGVLGVRSIQNFHMDIRGWSDIAYSYLIDRDSLDVYEGRGAGILGGHTFGRNSISHAICVMGNFDVTSVSDPLIDRVAELVAHGHQQGWWPSILTGGHRDVRATSCPGDNLYAQIEEINRRAVDPGDEEDNVALKNGDRGEAVRRFQTALKGWNSSSLPRFGADGDFGGETEIWVRNFQSAMDLNVNGTIDGITGSLLLEFRPDDVDDSA